MLQARRFALRWQRKAQQPCAWPRTFPALLPHGAAPRSASRVFCRENSSSSYEVASSVDELLESSARDLQLCREQGNWRQALKLLDRLDKHGCTLNAHMYEQAIAACARKGKVEVLPGLLQNMQIDSILPTSATVDFVVQAYLSQEQWALLVDFVHDVIQQGMPVSDAVWEATMEACGRSGEAVKARKIVQNAGQAASMRLLPAHVASAIRACGIARRPDVALQLSKLMEDQLELRADEQVFEQLIRGQIVNKALPQALQTFAVVHAREIELDEAIYTATINELVIQREYWSACRLFDQMLMARTKPSIFCLGRMMVAYSKTNRPDMAQACWDRIVAANEHISMPTKYVKMMRNMANTGNPELTLSIFNFLAERFAPHELRDTAYALAVRALGRLGRTQEAVDLFDSFMEHCETNDMRLPRSGALYLSVFNALSRDTQRNAQVNSRDAKRVWHLLVQNVEDVLPPAYASIAGVFASTGDKSALDKLMHHAQQAFAGAVEGDEAQGIMDNELEGDVDHLSTQSYQNLIYNGVISGFSKARDDYSAEVTSYLQLMREQGLIITDSVIRASTDSYVKHKCWNHVIKLLDYVRLENLENAELCYGDTISKLLEAHAWKAARAWIVDAHRNKLQPPIRGKMEVLRALKEEQSDQWQIAYALALETLSFKQVVQDNVNSVADAVEVCVNGKRLDLAIRLFERVRDHPSLVYQRSNSSSREALLIPQRMYTQVILSIMREYSVADSPTSKQEYIKRAESLCAEMLKLYGREVDGEALSVAISIKAAMADDDDVVALFESMQKRSIEPNSYALNAAIVGYSRLGHVDRVLGIRDDLAQRCQADPSFAVEPEVMRTLLYSLARAKEHTALFETVASSHSCSMEDVVHAYLRANHLEQCVKCFDASVTRGTFTKLMTRLQAKDRHLPLVAKLLLKAIAIHGLSSYVSNTEVVKIAKALVVHGEFETAAHIVELYTQQDLHTLPPFLQRELTETMLSIYGATHRLEPLCQLLEQHHAFPLSPQHFESAMTACLATPKAAEDSTDEHAVRCLQVLDISRRQFVKPNGKMYLLALRSCDRLKKMATTGAKVLDDVVENHMGRELTTALFTQARRAAAQVAKGTAPAPVARRGRGRPPKNVATPSPFQSQAEELARITLACHDRGIEVSKALAELLLQLSPYLPPEVANEVAFIHSGQEGKPLVAPPAV